MKNSNKSKIYTRKSTSHNIRGATALKHSEHKFIVREEPLKKSLVARKKKKSFRFAKKTKLNLNLAIYVNIFITFIGLGLIVSSYAAVNIKLVSINRLENSIRETSELNKDLKKDIMKETNLKDIEYIATTRLGMVEPQSHQIIHYKIPQNSYIFYDQEEWVHDEKKGNILSIFEKVIGYVKN